MNVRQQISIVACLGGLSVTTHAQEWVLRTSNGDDWGAVASSADGIKLAATSSVFSTNQGVYVSTNSGVTWMRTSAPSTNWSCIALSADAATLVAAVTGLNGSGGPILLSTNLGVTWSQSDAPEQFWISIASSADGTRLAAAGGTGLFTSIDSGATWVLRTNTPGGYWTGVSSSADGTKLLAVQNSSSAFVTNNFVFISTNSGTTWKAKTTPAPESLNWYAVASSSDGSKLIAAGRSQQGVYQSVDSGDNWTTIIPVTSSNFSSGVCMASSADGSVLLRGYVGEIYLSTNSGASWGLMPGPSRPWSSVAISADGSKFIGRADGLYTWQSPPTPVLRIEESTNQLDISWVVPSVSLKLQQTANPIGANHWSDVTTAVVLTNLYYHLVVPLPVANTYYRLASP